MLWNTIFNKSKNKKIEPNLNPYRLKVGEIYKEQIRTGKDGYKSGNCKKLTRKHKSKKGYILEFGKDKYNTDNIFRRKFSFKRCTRKIK